MPGIFKFDEFNAALHKDNPNYARIIRSELRIIYEILHNSKGRPHLGELASEMKKVSKSKWRKYTETRRYLEQVFPDLRNLLKGRLISFRTASLTKGEGGYINHELRWDSDTGDLNDLTHVRVREHVWWEDPDPAVLQYLDQNDETYKRAGEHFGVGNSAFTRGEAGNSTDTHHPTGPFGPNLVNFAGPGEIEHKIDQEYQYSEDRGQKWYPIPNSRYTIRRKISCTGRNIKVIITKKNIDGRGDSCTNFVEIPRA